MVSKLGIVPLGELAGCYPAREQPRTANLTLPSLKGVGILASTGESRKHGTKSRYFPRALYPQQAFFGIAHPYLEVIRSQGFLKEGA